MTNDDTASSIMDGNGIYTFSKFESALFACVEDVSLLLPALAERYDVLVVISALADHVGTAVQILVKRQVCDTRQARLLIKRIEDIALVRKVVVVPKGLQPYRSFHRFLIDFPTRSLQIVNRKGLQLDHVQSLFHS